VNRIAPGPSARLAWLTGRPIAHRGLHNEARGIIENTASAAVAAIAENYGIEADLQISADGEAMVHHDDALGRLTDGAGALRDWSAAALRRAPLRATADRMLTLGELIDLVAERTPLVIELKSRFDGDLRLATRAAALLAHYQGPVAVMSFDPAPVAQFRYIAPKLVRGVVAQRHYADADCRYLDAAQRRNLALLLHGPQTRPAFLAYRVHDLAAIVPRLARGLFALPVLAWTVRGAEDRAMAARFADQVIFEGFRA
jgi:glycerophosphoryl diester phosphodiesterase